MQNTEPKLKLLGKCPICGAEKDIEIPKSLLDQKKFGTIKIQIPQGAVCKDHHFLIFVDTKGIVRGYEKIDVHMASDTEEQVKLSFKFLIDKFGKESIKHLMHSVIFNYNAYILNDKEGINFTAEHMNDFLNGIVPGMYKGHDKIKYLASKEHLKKVKETNPNAVYIDSNKTILNVPWQDSLKFEEEIISKALQIISQHEQKVIIQQEVIKLVKEAEHGTTLLVMSDEKGISESDFIEGISRAMNIPKIGKDRYRVILNFIERKITSGLIRKIKGKLVKKTLRLLG